MSNHSFHGYVAVERYPDNINNANWVTLIGAIRDIEIDNGAAQYLLQERGNLDTFEYEGETYSNIYIWEARYAAGEINFENFRIELVLLFEVDDNDVTYTEGTTTIRDRLSCFARYKYNGKNRIRVGLFGCADDSNLCMWEQSRIECGGYIQDNIEDWEEEI